MIKTGTCRIFFALALLWSVQPAHSAPNEDQVLQLAVDAGNWIAAQGKTQTVGVAWPADANQPNAIAYDLGTGTSGIVVYFLTLYSATGDERFLETAEQGGAYLSSLLDDPAFFGVGSRRASLYTGVSGIGVALSLLAEHRPAFSADVKKIVRLLEDWSVTEPAGVRWSDDFNDLLYGDAGTILFLAWHAHRERDKEALRLATEASHFLLTQAADADHGRFWRFRRGRPDNLPGFSHGTAGIAYVLGTVGALTNESAFTDAAADGFAYIDSIAEIDDDKIRIPYGWPSEHWSGLYEFGWAHGLVGSDAFFTRLQQLGIETQKAARYNALVVNTLSNIGLPGTPEDPFAEPSLSLDWRFGRAGVLSLLSDYGEGVKTRNAICHALAAAATRDNGMAYWEVDAPAFMGGGRAAFTGKFHGAAGIGLALLRLHAAMLEHPPYVLMPDDPLAWVAGQQMMDPE